ncbi:MAG: M24 family metallopeptidase, partial [Pseudonocardia sp.]
MIELKTPDEIDAMAAAGRIVAAVLAAARDHAAPGVTTRELDTLARDLIADAGARPTFLGYHPDWAPTPYPGAICTSVNDAVVHGPPTDAPLRDGDVLTVDLAVHLDGWCADAAVGTVVGEADPADLQLIAAAEKALDAGLAQARPGA